MTRDYYRAELAAHATSIVAVFLTVVMVGTGQVAESNPGAARLIGTLGVEGWALLTPFGVAALFGLTRLLKRAYPRLARGTAYAVPGLFAVDALGNLVVLAVRGPPETVVWGDMAAVAAALVAVAAVVAFRVEVRRVVAYHRERTGRATTVAAVVILSVTLVLSGIPAGLFGSGAPAETVERASAAEGVVFDDFEDGDLSEWSTSGTAFVIDDTDSDAYQGSFSMEFNGSFTTTDRSLPADSYNSVGVRIKWKSFHNQYEYPRLDWGDGSTKAIAIRTDTSGNLVYKDSGGNIQDTGIDVTTGTYYRIRATNIDYNNNSYDIQVTDADGNTVGTFTGAEFENSISNIDTFSLGGYDGGHWNLDYLTANGATPSSPVSGTISNPNGTAIENAKVTVSQGGSTVTSTTTKFDGSWSVELGDGDYTVEASKAGYTTNSTSLTVAGKTTGVDLNLSVDSSYDYTMGVCYSGESEFQAGTAEAQWYHSTYAGYERDAYPNESKYGFSSGLYDTLAGGAGSTQAVFEPVGGFYDAYPAQTTFAYDGNTTTSLEPYAPEHEAMSYRVELTTDRAYYSIEKLDPSVNYNQFIFPGPPDSNDDENTTTQTAEDGGPCDTASDTSPVEETDGPTAIGSCTVPVNGTQKEGVQIEYWDPAYQTEELTYNLTYDGETFNGTVEFDSAKGYYYGCVGAGDVAPPGSGGDPGLNLGVEYSNGTDAAFNTTGFDSTDPSNAIGGGGPLVSEQAGSGAPVSALAIPAVAGIAYVLLRRRRGRGQTGGAGGSGGGGFF